MFWVGWRCLRQARLGAISGACCMGRGKVWCRGTVCRGRNYKGPNQLHMAKLNNGVAEGKGVPGKSGVHMGIQVGVWSMNIHCSAIGCQC